MDWYGDYSTTLSRNGVSVQAGMDLHRLPVPAVKYRVTNTGDDIVGVRLDVTLPDGISTSHVGFSPNAGAERWRAYADGRLIWSRPLHPGEEVVTLFGVWVTNPEQVYDLLEPPTITAVTPLDEASARAGQPRESTLPDEVRPDWWWDDAETAAKHVIDESFSRSRTAPLRRMIQGVEGALMGDPRKSVDSVDAADVSAVLSPPSDEELADTLAAGGPVNPDDCYHLRLAAGDDTDPDELLDALAAAERVTVAKGVVSDDERGRPTVLDVVVSSPGGRDAISETLARVSPNVDALITEIGDVPRVEDTSAEPESMRTFSAIRDEVSPLDDDEFDAAFDVDDDEYTITDLLATYTDTSADEGDAADQAGDAESESGAPPVSSGALVDRLVAELTDDDVSPRQRDELKDALDLTLPENSGQTDLASEVVRLRRVVDALLDELQLVEADLASLREEVDAADDQRPAER